MLKLSLESFFDSVFSLSPFSLFMTDSSWVDNVMNSNDELRVRFKKKQ